jgi:Spy/CpxP family protein refolding chaperone
MFFKAALDTDLSDDAKAGLDKLEEPVRGDTVPRHEMAAVHADLVASIKAGKVDTAKIQADEAAVTKAFAEHEADEATALGQLHDALSPPQRKAVTDAVRAAEAVHDRPPPSADAGAPDFVARRLERMKSQLVLDEDQQKQVGAVLARDVPSPGAMQAHYEAGKKQFEALLAAFEKDTFDPKKVDLSSTPGRKPTEPIDRQVKYVSQLLPILTAGQRDRFALLIEHPRPDRGRADITEPPEFGGRW